MADSKGSKVFWNPDGYVETILSGVVEADKIKELNKLVLQILDEQGAANLMIDARSGRIGRDAASFAAIMQLSRDRRLKKFFVLVDQTPTHPDAGRESGVIVSMLTAALGKRPLYIYNEAEVRSLAAEK